jgi:hypothetical protein
VYIPTKCNHSQRSQVSQQKRSKGRYRFQPLEYCNLLKAGAFSGVCFEFLTDHGPLSALMTCPGASPDSDSVLGRFGWMETIQGS